MDAKESMVKAWRASSDALARMGWARVLSLGALGLIAAAALPDWALLEPIKELAPFVALLAVIIKVESGARAKAVDGERKALALAGEASDVAKAWEGKLDPHFLFNAMATVEYLITADPALAIKTQSALAVYLRSGLGEPARSSSRAQSMACESYLTIQKVRLAERLDWSVSVGVDAPMPGRVAIGLLEKAVGMGIEPKIEGGRVEISCILAEDGGYAWTMSCPADGLSDADWEPWKDSWLRSAPNAGWSAVRGDRVWSIELKWKPSVPV